MKKIIESYGVRLIDSECVDIKPYLIGKENEEKIRRRFGEDLEIQNKISRGKRKYFLSSTPRKKILEEEEKKLKHSSQELKREGEIMLPKKGQKDSFIRRAIVIHWQADRLLF